MSDVEIFVRQPVRRSKAASLAKINAAARKLFVSKGYHGTRPQDIAREAGLGHGTFYLHYADKRACFLAFVEEARAELDLSMRHARAPGQSLEDMIGATLNALYDYSDSHPGVLRAALTEEEVIDAGGSPGQPLLTAWGREWADILAQKAQAGQANSNFDTSIIGQAIVGALHQAGRAGAKRKQCRVALVDNLTRFLAKALEPN